ncbi:MAG: sigma-70 family RNA polymerase sigma factor [Armatimonadetes bacterium]|nr:sigma-70 family RNA polymerase sigma factor [Armatimonadota bacterium]
MSQDTSAAMTMGGAGALLLNRGGTEVRPRLPIAGTGVGLDAAAGAVVPDDALVARARAGEQDAFETLVRRYQDRVYTIIHGFVRDPEDALDLTQDTFVKAYQALGRFRGGASFYTWVYRIAVNNCKDALRRRASRPWLSLEDEHFQELGFEPAADPGNDPAEVVEADEMRVVVRRAVAMLPEKLRAAITLHDLEGIPQQEVARILGCPLGTVKSHVFRGRARLRKLLRRYVEGSE